MTEPRAPMTDADFKAEFEKNFREFFGEDCTPGYYEMLDDVELIRKSISHDKPEMWEVTKRLAQTIRGMSSSMETIEHHQELFGKRPPAPPLYTMTKYDNLLAATSRPAETLANLMFDFASLQWEIFYGKNRCAFVEAGNRIKALEAKVAALEEKARVEEFQKPAGSDEGENL
jgi:hypothetical protein